MFGHTVMEMLMCVIGINAKSLQLHNKQDE